MSIFLNSDSLAAARAILGRRGAASRVFNPDGTINRAALAREIAEAEFAASAANSEVQFHPVDKWVEKQGGKGVKGMKAPTPGKYSGHRATPSGWKYEGR